MAKSYREKEWPYRWPWGPVNKSATAAAKFIVQLAQRFQRSNTFSLRIFPVIGDAVELS